MFKKIIKHMKKIGKIFEGKSFIFSSKKYIHIRTNKIYYVFGTIVNKTSGNLDGQELTFYTDGEKLYVREINEFMEKFKEVE